MAPIDEPRRPWIKPTSARSFIQRVPELNTLNSLKDFTITCNNRSWRVHRMVMVLHSSVLTKTCTSDFREANEGAMDMSDHAEDVVDCLVQYLYSFDYEPEAPDSNPRHLSCHVEVALLADKYDIPDLKMTAVRKFGDSLPSKEADSEAWEGFVEAACLAYEYRIVLKPICVEVVHQLVGKTQYLFEPTLTKYAEKAMAECPKLAMDVARHQRLTLQYSHEKAVFKCPSCSGAFWAVIEDNDIEVDCSMDEGECAYHTSGKNWRARHRVLDGDSTIDWPYRGTWWED